MPLDVISITFRSTHGKIILLLLFSLVESIVLTTLFSLWAFFVFDLYRCAKTVFDVTTKLFLAK